MQRRVSFEISLQQLLLKDTFINESFDTFDRVLLGSDVEDGPMLEVSQLKVLFGICEILHDHRVVVFSNGVVDGQVAVVVFGVELGSDVLHNICLSFLADDVLNGLALVILLASCSEEVVGAREPVECLDIALSSADKEHVLAKIVLNNNGSRFPGFKNSQESEISSLTRHKEWRSSLKVGLHAEFWIVIKYLLGGLNVILLACYVEGTVTMHCIFGTEVNV